MSTDLFPEYDSYLESSNNVRPFIYEEDDGTVSLHFEISSVQSRMHAGSPDWLMLGYTRIIMGFLLFKSRPKHIGMIGLGGGSIPKYCYSYLPHSQISIAEINPEVIALRDNFYIPDDNLRFRVFCQDGADFVLSNPNQFDVLVVDGFDMTGQPKQLCSQRFYDDCYKALTPDGIVVANLCDGPVETLISRMRRSFSGRVVVADSPYSDNRIAFASKENALFRSGQNFANVIEQLQQRHPLDLSEVARCIQRALQRHLRLRDESTAKYTNVVEIRR
jgi:spermidine synthase